MVYINPDHKSCISMGTSTFEHLENNTNISYICCKCNTPNFVGSLYHSYEIKLSNSYAPLQGMSDTHDSSIFLKSPSETEFQPSKHSSPHNTSYARRPTSIHTSTSTHTKSTSLSTDNSIDHNTLPAKSNNWRTLVINANSISGKQAELDRLISYTQPDMILMSETKLDSNILNSEFISKDHNYSIYRRDRKRGGGGVLIAIKSTFTHQEVPMDSVDGEVLWIEILLQNKNKMYAGSYYRPPDQSTDRIEALNDSLNIIMEKTRNNPSSTILLGGDFNARDIDWETLSIDANSDKKLLHARLLEILDEHHLTQHQLEPTREGKVLDLFCTNKPSLVKSMHTIPGISDHDIPTADCTISPHYNKKMPRTVFNYKKADWEKIKANAKDFTSKFLTDYLNNTVEENWNSFKSFILQQMSKHIPSRQTSSRHNLPWITVNIKRMINKKQRLYNKAKKTKKQTDWASYNHQKKITLKAMRAARWTYINEILAEGLNNNNNKPFWRYVKTQKQENIGVAPLKVGGTLHSDSSEKAQILNEKFQSVFTQEDGDDLPHIDEPHYPPIQDLVINTDGVAKMLQNLNINKVSGPDKIPCRILKELSQEIAPALTAIFEQSIQSGTLPKDWRQAYISPIFKKGNQNQASNYRPISLTCICCKLLEHVVCKHMLNHLDLYNILACVQHGFRYAHS